MNTINTMSTMSVLNVPQFTFAKDYRGKLAYCTFDLNWQPSPWNQEFCLAPSNTMVEQVNPIWGWSIEVKRTVVARWNLRVIESDKLGEYLIDLWERTLPMVGNNLFTNDFKKSE